MKTKILSLILLGLALSAQASEKTQRKPASAGSLTGTNAAQMVKILEDAGIKPAKTLIEAFDVICQGSSFQDFCMVATQISDPASHRLTIRSTYSGQFWSLLKSAGLPQAISTLSDGTAGQWVITGASIVCSLNSEGASDECVVNSD